MPKLPLCSSAEIITVFQRNGFYSGKGKPGSHQPFYKDLPNGRKLTVTIVVGKKEIPRPTLSDWLKRGQKSRDHFIEILRS